MSQFSNMQNPLAKSAYNVPKPPSPKAEKEILNQLDELKSELSGWIQKIGREKKSSPQKISQMRSKSTNERVVDRIKLKQLDPSSSEDERYHNELRADSDVESSEKEDDEELKVIDEIHDKVERTKSTILPDTSNDMPFARAETRDLKHT